MKINGNTILITGGGTGIGLSLAEAFVKADNEVIICGRRENKLNDAKKMLGDIHVKTCDVSSVEKRAALFKWVNTNFPQVNVLINNAGIQRNLDFQRGIENLLQGEDEIEVNLVAPIHLSAHFIPLLSTQKESAIVNVSSGLGFIPLAFMPIYCATKAALHSFTVSLRHQLRKTAVKVFELIPPSTDTELGGHRERGHSHGGIPPGEVAERALEGMKNDEFEIAVGMAGGLRKGSLQNFDEAFRNMNRF